MELNVAVCDDEKKYSDKLCEYLSKFSFEHEVEFYPSVFSSGDELVNSYQNGQSGYDIIFLDVEMPGIDGMETAAKIRSIPDDNVCIVFITSYPDYMQDSFDVQASQYLLKPLEYDLFDEKLCKIIKRIKNSQSNIEVISQRNGGTILHLDKIIYFETIKSQSTKYDLCVVTEDDTMFVKGKIADFEERLKDKGFISVHRSVLVNMKYIKKFTNDTVFLTNGKEVNSSRRKLKDIKEAFSKYTVEGYK